MVPFHKYCEKIVNSAVFEAENPEMGLDLRKFRKKLSNQRFLSENNP